MYQVETHRENLTVRTTFGDIVDTVGKFSAMDYEWDNASAFHNVEQRPSFRVILYFSRNVRVYNSIEEYVEAHKDEPRKG